MEQKPIVLQRHSQNSFVLLFRDGSSKKLHNFFLQSNYGMDIHLTVLTLPHTKCCLTCWFFFEKNYSLPSKFLNVYGFGMKMYTSQPITAQLFFQEELWLVESCTFSCRNRTRSGTLTVWWMSISFTKGFGTAIGMCCLWRRFKQMIHHKLCVSDSASL